MRKEFGVREEVSQKMERSWFLSSHSGHPRRRPGATRNPGISGTWMPASAGTTKERALFLSHYS